MIDPQKAAIAKLLVEAIATADAVALGGLFAPDASVWHNTDQVDMSIPELQGMLGAIGGVSTAEVDLTGLRDTPDGFVLTLKSVYQLNSGGTTEFCAAQIVQLDAAGKIARIDEYLDSAGLGPLVAEVGAVSAS
jgi:hypothetical protein